MVLCSRPSQNALTLVLCLQVVGAVLVQAAQASAPHACAGPYEEPEEEQARLKAVSTILQQQQQQQQQPVGALELLGVLLPPHLVGSPGVKYLLTEKFVLGQQRWAPLRVFLCVMYVYVLCVCVCARARAYVCVRASVCGWMCLEPHKPS